MKKICIITENSTFLEDLVQQISRNDDELEIIKEYTNDCDAYFVDENEDKANEISSTNKISSIILFSSKIYTSDFADIVIKKPFSLAQFLLDFKNNNLLPKVRRKECIFFQEYSLYPVKKEIYSSKTNETIKLTEKEVTILKYLNNNSSKVVSKDELLENVWEYSTEVTTHTVETHIYRLRQKVEKNNGSQIIITENSGYRLNI